VNARWTTLGGCPKMILHDFVWKKRLGKENVL
jgi:hypothetical protein